MAKEEYMALLMGMGMSDVDADTVYDCILTKEVCTWTSCDPIPDDLETKLNEYLGPHGLRVSITPITTRGQYIWEVKKIKQNQ
ncbi:MAG: hypothetical protein N3H30_00385 [Candidatus Micrarchaeota archaeon]|nr:hypothetical protein [Candidatus Micrarchaeota archaeon]